MTEPSSIETTLLNRIANLLKNAGNRVKITITAEFIPAKKEEGIE